MTDDIYSRSIWDDLTADEPALDLKEARRLPALRRADSRRPGHPRQPNLCTVYRWTDEKIGARPAGGGPRVVLESFQQGGRRSTTKSAVLRFLRRLTSPATATRPTAAAVAREHAAADRRLAAAGL